MLVLDLSEFERRAKELSGALDQVPYALSVALNDAAKVTRRTLIDETWPKHVTVRNKTFMRAALLTEFATKSNLEVAIYDSLGRGHLKLHAQGGTKQARGRLAVPTAAVRRGSSGVVKSQRPAALKRKVVRGGLIFQAEGRGKNSKLRLMYKLAASARIKKDVPFQEDFARQMAAEVRRAYPTAMARAMRTRR